MDNKNNAEDYKFFNDRIPCGFMRYTCEKQPRVTYINQEMLDILRFPEVEDGEMDYRDLYMNNIFLMIPMEERRRFSVFLNRVYSQEMPIAGELALLRCDGTRAYVFGWVAKVKNEAGQEEFQSVCMDITESHKARKHDENERYLKALRDVYDKIFEFNLDNHTVKCIHSESSSSFKQFEDISMQIEEATEKWIINSVTQEDQDSVRSFFRDFCQKKLYDVDTRPPQISYRAMSSQGFYKNYNGIFIKIEEALSFYCCRAIADRTETDDLREENGQLKNLVKCFTDGLAAFEVSASGVVKPLYSSENVIEFFGYTKDEWYQLMKKGMPLDNFIAYSEASHEEFDELLRKGEAEFSYFDFKTEREKRIKAICSPKEAEPNTDRYIMLYDVEDAKNNIEKKNLAEKRTVYIRTFGYFDVFIGDKPIAFRNKKSKELFALLVDRKGGFVTSEEAISYLWEDEDANAVTLARYRKVALRLRNTLEEYGIANVVESVDGKRRLASELVKCDLYDYLSGKEEYSQLFKGSYLTNYSWAETTLGELTNG